MEQQQKSPLAWSSLDVLVIEDEPFARRMIASHLKKLGARRVLEAENGRLGLQAAQLTKPTVILCDIHMPEVDGMGFLKSLREHADLTLRMTPVVFLTADADLSTVKVAKHLAVSGYMVKPATQQGLKVRLESLLGMTS